jgi:hypothetical protein
MKSMLPLIIAVPHLNQTAYSDYRQPIAVSFNLLGISYQLSQSMQIGFKNTGIFLLFTVGIQGQILHYPGLPFFQIYQMFQQPLENVRR